MLRWEVVAICCHISVLSHESAALWGACVCLLVESVDSVFDTVPRLLVIADMVLGKTMQAPAV